jgi:hypothetical protein
VNSGPSTLEDQSSSEATSDNAEKAMNTTQTIFLGFSTPTTQQEKMRFITSYGKVDLMDFPIDFINMKSRGFIFVTYCDLASHKKAIHDNMLREVDERFITISTADTEKKGLPKRKIGSSEEEHKCSCGEPSSSMRRMTESGNESD